MTVAQDEPAARPDVVQAIFDALISMDAARLDQICQREPPVTSTERRRAEEMFAAVMQAEGDVRDRRAQVWDVLIAAQWDSPPTLPELFDELTPERASRLADIYDALPDHLRAEYDRRYGPPTARPDGPDQLGTGSAEAAPWRGARTLGELGELTAQFLEGRLSQPAIHARRPDDDTAGLVPLLAALSRAGFVIRQWQPGLTSRDSGLEQRPSVSAFASDEAFAGLMAAVVESDLMISAARAAAEDEPPVYCIARDRGQERGRSGGAYSRDSLRRLYGPSYHAQAVEDLCGAWQLTIVDPRWGPGDQLWQVLRQVVSAP